MPFGDVVVHLLLHPGDDRVDLDHLPPTVPLHWVGVATLHCLIPPHPGDPRVVAAEGALQGFYLPQVAAQVGVAPVQLRTKRSASCSATVRVGVTEIRFTG